MIALGTALFILSFNPPPLLSSSSPPLNFFFSRNVYARCAHVGLFISRTPDTPAYWPGFALDTPGSPDCPRVRPRCKPAPNGCYYRSVFVSHTSHTLAHTRTGIPAHRPSRTAHRSRTTSLRPRRPGLGASQLNDIGITVQRATPPVQLRTTAIPVCKHQDRRTAANPSHLLASISTLTHHHHILST